MHLWIQSTKDKKYLEKVCIYTDLFPKHGSKTAIYIVVGITSNPEMIESLWEDMHKLYKCKYYIILCKGLEYPWIFVSVGSLGASFP
jgi:hypothetical protein